jgi:ATP-binding cassette, subfamily F, member 3
MTEIEVKNLEKFHGSNHVLKGVSFEVLKGERVAFIGKNGCGKSTLFTILVEKEKQDKGDVFITSNATVGMVEQVPVFNNESRVEDILHIAFEKIHAIKRSMDKIEREMESSNPTNEVLKRYGELQQQFENLGGYETENKIFRVCQGLKIPLELLDNKFQTLSGGEKTRVILAKAILLSPDILLLDEPTNHLDLSSMEWLENFLLEYKGTVLIISHDRFFLDKVSNKVIEMEEGKANVFKGNYTNYQKLKTEILDKQQHEYKLQTQKVRKMEATVKTLHQWGNRANEASLHHAASKLQEKVKELKKQPKPGFERNLDSEFCVSSFSSHEVVVVKSASKSFGEKKLFEDLDLTIRRGERVAFVGDNGSGKSTLIKAIVDEVSLDKGAAKLGESIEPAYLPQNIVFEKANISILDTLRYELEISEGDAKALLVKYHFFNDDWHKCISNISGGEQMRLKICILMQKDINLLLLDEPTNHMDIKTREWLEKTLETYNGTIVFVSHDRYFINKFATRIVEFENGCVNNFACDFNDYREIKGRTLQKEIEKPKGLPKVKPINKQVKNDNDTSLPKLEARIAELEKILNEAEGRLSGGNDDYLMQMQSIRECEGIKNQIDIMYQEWYELSKDKE